MHRLSWSWSVLEGGYLEKGSGGGKGWRQVIRDSRELSSVMQTSLNQIHLWKS